MASSLILSPLPTPLGHHRASSWVPCAIQQLPTNYLFYTWQCIYVSAALPICPILSCPSPCPQVHSLCLHLYSCAAKWMIQTNSMTFHLRERKSLVHIVLPLLYEGREFSDFKRRFLYCLLWAKALEEIVWELNLFYCPRLTIFFVTERTWKYVCQLLSMFLEIFQIRTFASEKI